MIVKPNRIGCLLVFCPAACSANSSEPADLQGTDNSSISASSSQASDSWEGFCRADIPADWSTKIKGHAEPIDPTLGELMWTDGEDSLYEPIGRMTRSGDDRSAYWVSEDGTATKLVDIDGYDSVLQVAVSGDDVALLYSVGNTGHPVPPSGITVWNRARGDEPQQIVPRSGVQEFNNTGGTDGLLWIEGWLWYARLDSTDPDTILLMRYSPDAASEELVAQGATDKMTLWNGTLVSVGQDKLSLRQFDPKTGKELDLDPRLKGFTNVDMVTGNDDYLVFQVRTGDDETNQYWIVGPDGLKARLAAESTSTPQAGDELLDRWRDFLPVENDFVLARGNNAPIIIDLQTQKWAAVPEAYDAWSGYLSFVDVETEDYWEWQSPVPTSELSRLQGCASQPPEYSWDW